MKRQLAGTDEPSPFPWMIATAAVISTAILVCIGIVMIHIYRHSASSMSSPIMSSSAPPITRLAAGDCVKIIETATAPSWEPMPSPADNITIRPEGCASPAAGYTVVEVIGLTDSCPDTASHITDASRIYCLAPNLITSHCYTLPADNSWIVSAECETAGTMRVESLHPGVETASACPHRHWAYWWHRPAITVCVTKS